MLVWLQGLDSASDQWLMEHWAQLDRAVLAHISDVTVEAMRRVLTPDATRE